MPLLLDEHHLCLLCKHKIKPLSEPLCFKCAHPLPPFDDRYRLCSHCRSNKPYFDRGFSLVEYDEVTKHIFHQIKFQKKPWLLDIFNDLLKESLGQMDLNNYDMIVPVPLDSSRERKRGFNQAVMIAKIMKQLHPLNTADIQRMIRKDKKTLPQSRLRRNQRLCNLENAFSVKRSPLIEGKNVILVDDIFTTGSTVNECARILKENGAERVDFFTIARSKSL